MSTWTLVARPEGDGIAAELTIDGGSPLTLGRVEIERLGAALENALAGVDDMYSRISCVNAGNQIVVSVDKITVAALRYDKADLMCSQLKELLAGQGTEFIG
ncbi:MAG: hypothetical protein ACTHK9_01410 [Nitrobacter sp.]|jgi:hypothetical protein|nr:hypothetical protein [Nitrospira sp.]